MIAICTLLAAGLTGGQAKLVASDPSVRPYFGWSVDVDGTTVVVGAKEAYKALPTPKTGAVYVYENVAGSWYEQAKLTPGNGEGYDYFGLSTAIQGDTVVAGSWRSGAIDEGSVYVFERNGTSWTEEHQLTANDAGFLDAFGYSVDFSGDTILVGALYDDTAAGIDAGSAYVFVRSGSNWIQQAKLTASNAAANDQFGYSVSIDGDVAVVGAYLPEVGGIYTGAVYVYRRNGTLWSEEAQLVSSGGAGGGFGSRVAVAGETIVAGRLYDGVSIGSAHVFERSGTSWNQTSELVASNAGFFDFFGMWVAVDDGAIVVGAPGEGNTFPVGASKGPGAAYVFSRCGAGWIESAKLTAADGEDGDSMSACAIDDDTIVVGAYFDDHTPLWDEGSAYVFCKPPAGPVSYCTAGTSASGCRAAIGTAGTASASAPSGFFLNATSVEGDKDGVFFYGSSGRQANPWGNGTSYQCVIPPVRRGGKLTGSGAAGTCGGSFALDLNARWCPTCPRPNHNPGPGAVVQAQLWYRDPLNTSNQTTGFSDAVELCVGP